MTNFELLEKLCCANGISGDENNIRNIILSEIEGYATEISVDALGNIIVFKKGDAKPDKKLMISAHMDEVGFIVTDIDSNGYVKFDEVGGIDKRIIPGTTVVINNKVNGVTGVKSIHLCSGDENTSIPKLSDMYIDIGCDSREDAFNYVSIGDSINFINNYYENNYTIQSKALDDRIGCFILIEMIKSKLPYDIYFTFVVQEEVGLRGAKVASYTVNPDFAIVLESTTAADLPNISKTKQVCNVDGGAVVGFMDRSTIYDKEMINCSKNIALEKGCKLQFKRAVAGGNDAGAIHCSGNGVRTLAISVPARYLHSQLTLVSKSDIKDVYNLATELSLRITEDNL